jgi:hypothetical protein
MVLPRTSKMTDQSADSVATGGAGPSSDESATTGDKTKIVGILKARKNKNSLIKRKMKYEEFDIEVEDPPKDRVQVLRVLVHGKGPASVVIEMEDSEPEDDSEDKTQEDGENVNVPELVIISDDDGSKTGSVQVVDDSDGSEDRENSSERPPVVHCVHLDHNYTRIRPK